MFKKTFNQFVILAVALFSLSIMSACSDDDKKKNDPDDPGTDNPVSVSSDIVGEWELVRSKGWEKKDGEIVDEWDEDAFDGEYSFVFKSSGKCVSYEDGELESSGRYKLNGDKLTIYDDDDDDEYTYTCKIKGDRMTLIARDKEKYDGATYEYYDEGIFQRVD